MTDTNYRRSGGKVRSKRLIDGYRDSVLESRNQKRAYRKKKIKQTRKERRRNKMNLNSTETI